MVERMANMRKKTKGDKIFDVFLYVFFIIMMLIMFVPVWHVLMASFSNSEQLIRHSGLVLRPLGFSFSAYKMVAANPNIISGYGTTLIVLFCGTALSLVLTTMAAYVLSRKGVGLNKFFMGMIMVTMFFNGGMIPTYMVINNTLHMGNSILALIIPGSVNVWNLLVMRTTFAQIPDALIESAKIEGANDVQILVKIVVPTSKAIIAVMVLFYGVTYWNSWFNALLYIRDRSKYPLQLILREILINSSVRDMSGSTAANEISAVAESIKYATIVVATVPILCAYPFLQKYFVKGIMIGSVKG